MGRPIKLSTIDRLTRAANSLFKRAKTNEKKALTLETKYYQQKRNKGK